MKKTEYKKLTNKLEVAGGYADDARISMLDALWRYIGDRTKDEHAKRAIMVVLDDIFLQRGKFEKTNNEAFVDNPMGTLAVILSTALRGLNTFDMLESDEINQYMRDALEAETDFEKQARELAQRISNDVTSWKESNAVNQMLEETTKFYPSRFDKVREVIGESTTVGDRLNMMQEYMDAHFLED